MRPAGGLEGPGGSVILPPAQRAEMIALARAGAPAEVCGVLAGDFGRVARVYPVTNLDADPRRYHMDPKGLLQSIRALDNLGMELLGFYHSHPSSLAVPSETDLALAFYPESYYAIISLRTPDAPDVRFFRLRDGAFAETEVRSED